MQGSEDWEIDRIRAEYKRREREIPLDFYAWNRPVNQFFSSQAARASIRALVKHGMFPLENRTLVDVGCGQGARLIDWLQWGAPCGHLAGIELDAEQAQAARGALPGADIRVGDARTLPWRGASFDVVSQSLLFTSILAPAVKRKIASEMLRVLKPDGLILWYDFRYDNPRNPNVRGIEAGEIRSLFPACRVKLQKVTLAPPIARILVPLSWIAALALEKIPFLRTHYLGVIRKRPGGDRAGDG